MVKLGDVYRDELTGFEGIAVARAEFIYGCVRVTLEAKKLKDDGTPLDATFDEQRLDPVSKAKTGGPLPIPARARAPSRTGS